MAICPDLGEHFSLKALLRHSALSIDTSISHLDDVPVLGCVARHDQVRPGDIFVAIRGLEHDGNEWINEAIARGASAVLTDRPLSNDSRSAPVYRVPDARIAFGFLSQMLHGDPSKQLKVIGISGTNGKTTTACLLAGILSRAGRRVGLLGTLGYFDGNEVADPALTTPAADNLAHWLGKMVRNKCSHAVMEVSSHAIDQSRIAGIEFDAVCLTNITGDHLDYHGSMDNYIATKRHLFDACSSSTLAVMNADDPISSTFIKELDRPVLTIGIHAEADITAEILEQHQHELLFMCMAGDDAALVRTAMIGEHHVYNCLTATAVGLSCGYDLATIAKGLESAGYVPGRLERIDCGQPYGVFVDYAHTPDALTRCLATLRQVTRGKLICVFGAGGDRDRIKRPLMGKAVETLADQAIITSDNPRGEEPLDIMDDILEGFEYPGKARLTPDRTEAIHQALSDAKPGDCILIAGKGHETWQEIGEERMPFDDADIVRRWLYENLPYAENFS